VISAVAAAGLPCDRFVFEGFLPVKGKARKARLTALKTEPRTTVFYESPHRILKTLADLIDTVGPDRPITLARELTKRYEEFWRGTLTDALAHYQTTVPKGEFTLILGPATANTQTLSPEEITAQLTQLLASGQSRSEASRTLARQTALSKRDIYQLSLQIDIYSVLQDKSEEPEHLLD
ncbi:MAG: SAM-dependent methyltransferase, partial [Cyanobacteria bacterium J06649_4]